MSSNLDATAILNLDFPKIDAMLTRAYSLVPTEQPKFTAWLFDGEKPNEVAGGKGFWTKCYKELKVKFENDLAYETHTLAKKGLAKSHAEADRTARVSLAAAKSRTILAEIMMDAYTQKYFCFLQTGKISHSQGG